VVVANLKPAKLMGVESRGMLLAVVDEGKGLSLVTVDKETPPGGRLS
jgi:methionyl-tRNA synthetase